MIDILNTDKGGDFATKCIKTVGILPPSTSVYVPNTVMLGTNGWSVNIT